MTLLELGFMLEIEIQLRNVPTLSALYGINTFSTTTFQNPIISVCKIPKLHHSRRFCIQQNMDQPHLLFFLPIVPTIPHLKLLQNIHEHVIEYVLSYHFSQLQPSPKLIWGITPSFYRLGVIFRFVSMGFRGWFGISGHMDLPRQLNIYIG